jgi:hypothetical protein
MDRVSVHRRPPTTRGREQLVAQRVVDDAEHETGVVLARDAHRPLRDSEDEIRRAVERIDDPAPAARAGREAGLLAEDRILRVRRADRTHDDLLGRAIGVGHQIRRARLRSDPGARLIEAFAQQRARGARGLDREVKLVHVRRYAICMPLFGRREPDPTVAAARAAFDQVAVHVDAAQRALLTAIPTSRDPGIPLAQALAEFGRHLARATEALEDWPGVPEGAHEGTKCSEALAAARGEAERLRLGPEPSGFEALNARVGDVLHPLEALADVERALRRA